MKTETPRSVTCPSCGQKTTIEGTVEPRTPVTCACGATVPTPVEDEKNKPPIIWQVVGISVPLVLIGFSIFSLIRFYTRDTTIKRPAWVIQRAQERLRQPLEKIDLGALETMTLTRAEWDELGQLEGKFKNPNTGKYSMVPAIKCRACGATIPTAPGTYESPVGAGAAEELAKYKCPNCGKNAYMADH